MDYNVYPVIDCQKSDFPLTPEPLSLEKAQAAVTSRIKMMEEQGHWRDDRGQKVPLHCVAYLIEPSLPSDDEDDDDARLLGEDAEGGE